MLGFAIQTFRYSHMDLFSHLGCLVCGILSFVFLIYSNTFLIFWHSHKCTFSYLYFSQLGCPSFRNYQFQFYQFCHSQQEVPSFVFPSFMSLPTGLLSVKNDFPKAIIYLSFLSCLPTHEYSIVGIQRPPSVSTLEVAKFRLVAKYLLVSGGFLDQFSMEFNGQSGFSDR